MNSTRSSAGNAHIRHVDGLRAVAVLSVMIYHLFPKWLPGGLAGVDVFFAISGFVVTASLVQHSGESLGRFIGGFYQRRMTRILPALVVVLLVTALVYVLLIPASWLSNSNEKIAFLAFFGLSNFGLQSQSDSYFSPRAEFNPFTHTWSLGVEEQFYLIAPFLLYLQVFRRRVGSERFAHPWALLSIAVASVLLMIYWSKTDPLMAFYNIGGRLFELAAGCLWFLYVWMGRNGAKNSTRSWALDVVGIALLAAVFLFTNAAAFPFPWAVVAVLASICLIGLPRDHSPIRAALAGRWPVWIGLRSYSLYLWHWPVYVLMRWTVGLDKWWTWPIAFGVSVLLAAISYRWVESPLRRNRRWLALRPAFAILIAASVTTLAASATVRLFNVRDRIGLSTVTRHSTDWYVGHTDPTVVDTSMACRTHLSYRNFSGILAIEHRPEVCTGDAPWRGRTMFVFGDSHATSYVPLFHRLSVDTGMAVVIYTVPGCPFLGLGAPMGTGLPPTCIAQPKQAVEDALRQAVPGDVVFLPSLRVPRFGDQWGQYDEAEVMRRAQPLSTEARKQVVTDALNWLAPFEARDMNIIFDAPKPILRAPPFRCVDPWNSMNEVCAHGLTMPRAFEESFRAPPLALMRELTDQMRKATMFDPLPALCGETTCSAFSASGRPLFFDADHVSRYANEVLYPSFRRQLADIGK